MKKGMGTNVKRSALLLAIILIFFFKPLDSHGYDPPEYIKVGLKHGTSAPVECKVSSSSGFMLGTVEKGGFAETMSLSDHNELTAYSMGGQVMLKSGDGILITSNIGPNDCLMPDGGGQILSVNGQKFRGGIMLKGDPNERLTIINYLTLEEYLYGVVHREMGMSSPLEALKAQAITARTFAALNKGRHSSSGFDVCSGTHCQVYGGCADEYESTNRAVDETAGMIIYCGGRPAETFYYKNSGGHTQNSEHVWSASVPHLKGKPDPYCPEYPWTAVIDMNTLRQRLIGAGMDPGNIFSVKIGGHNTANAVASLIISGEKGNVILEKSKIRDVLGATTVRSTHFTIESTYDSVEPADSDFRLNLLSSGAKRTASTTDHVYLISKDGKIESDILSLFISKGNSSVKVQSYAKGQNSGKPTATDLILKGQGYGHGVGMAQDGAIQMARSGMTYIDILKFYYTGIEVY